MWGIIIVLVLIIAIGVGAFFLFRYLADQTSEIIPDIPGPDDILPFEEIGKNDEFWDDEPKEIE